MIVLAAKIFETTHGVSKLLQYKRRDLIKAADLIKTEYESLH